MEKVLWRPCNTSQYHLCFHFFLFKTSQDHTERTYECEVCRCIKSLLNIPTGMTEPRKMLNSNEFRVTLLFFSIRDFISDTFTRYRQSS